MLWTTDKVRETFLNYFKGLNHVIVPSIPLVNQNDPSLLFVNAGMNAFKDIFLGTKEPSYRRVANTQRCLRVSGKHNDLEEVGHDTYHHTFFEMLGNWSFGDYFKAEAIQWAWQLLTEVYGIPSERLWVTVFNGEGVENVNYDHESHSIWKTIVPEERILAFPAKFNFWEMGDVGPCGPCTEIHIDLRPDSERKTIPASQLINGNDPRVIELWNLVFIQYERFADGTLKPLPNFHVDTGMGLERLVMVLQGKESTYEIDLFLPIRTALREMVEKLPQTNEEMVAERVILDHIRAITFAIADGQIPSNTGAGYVIRRILRRAVRYAYQFLHLQEPFLHQLVPVVLKTYENVFPEVLPQQAFVTQMVKEEEENFFARISRGIRLFEEQVKRLSGNQIPGKMVFELYDTYGFPADLTALMARERGLTIDMAGFEQCLEEQKRRSRQATQLQTGDWIVLEETQNPTHFVGYETLEAPVRIMRYRQVKKGTKTYYQIVLNQTPFYPEGGGQVGDTGVLIQGNVQLSIVDTRKENEEIVHYLEWIPDDLKGEWIAKVDRKRREATMRHHTATHLLHAVLRQTLGTHVEQRGSYVGPDYLRFDFSHYEKVSLEKRLEIEKRINEAIQAELPVRAHQDVPLEEAKRMGAMALFGEKYGENVRVIQIGDNFSLELCGGTHVQNTREIIHFKIVSESAIGAGIRRIEARAGYAAIAHLEAEAKRLQEMIQLLDNPSDPIAKVKKVLNEMEAKDNLIKNYESFIKEEVSKSIVEDRKSAQFRSYRGLPVHLLREIGQELKRNGTLPVLLCLASEEGSQVQCVLFTGKKELDAKAILISLLEKVGGRGGGNPTFAIGTLPKEALSQFHALFLETAISFTGELDKGVI